MALNVWCRCLPSRPFLFVAPEDRGGQLQHVPASIWQVPEVTTIVKRTREATWSCAFACELRAEDCPHPLAFISNLGHLSSRLIQSRPRLQLKGDFLEYSGPLRHSCTCGKNHRALRGIAHRGQFATQVLPMFPVEFWATALEATNKTRWDGVSIQKGKRKQSLSTLHHPGSPGYRYLLTVSWTLSESSWLRPSLLSQVVPLIFHRLILPLAPTLPSKVHRLWLPHPR